MRVYLDNAATTPIDPEVLKVMTAVMAQNYGNPSSIHAIGRGARTVIEDARKRVAQYLNASTGEIFFTSSATESNNTALFCAVRDLGVQRIISSPTEHPCILNSLAYIREYFKITVDFVQVDHAGNIDLAQLTDLLADSSNKTLVALMHGNNEIGTMIDLDMISQLCSEYNALFHCDAVQTVAKLPIDLSRSKVSFLSASGHKIYGPKGVGILYVNSENQVSALIKGGGQERNMRSGTENVYGITGFAEAMTSLAKHDDYFVEIDHIRQYFKSRLIDADIDILFNGNQDRLYLPHILSVSIPKSDKSDLIMFNLDINGICASAGSACSSGTEHDSHVMAAIRQPHDRKTIRFSLSHHNTKEEIDYTVAKLTSIIKG